MKSKTCNKGIGGRAVKGINIYHRSRLAQVQISAGQRINPRFLIVHRLACEYTLALYSGSCYDATKIYNDHMTRARNATKKSNNYIDKVSQIKVLISHLMITSWQLSLNKWVG